MKMIKLQIHSVPGYQPGQVIDAALDREGVLIDKFLRRRLADARFDNCIQIVKPKKQSAKEMAK